MEQSPSNPRSNRQAIRARLRALLRGAVSAFDIGLRAGAAKRTRSSAASDARAIRRDWERVTGYLESAAKRAVRPE